MAMQHTARGSVLVATDLTPESDEAVRQGAALAGDLGCPMVVRHAPPAKSALERLFRRESRELSIDGSIDATSIDDGIRAQVTRVLGVSALRVTVADDAGTDHGDLAEMAERAGASFVVTCPGAAAAHAVGRVGVPVLVARPSPSGAVVGATDFLAPSLAGVQRAAHEARRRGAALHLVHVLDSSINLLGDTSRAIATATGLPVMTAAGSSARLDAAERMLQAQLGTLSIDGHTAIMPGHADFAIVAYAEQIGASLVVVGTHGCSPLSRMLLGSTAANVIDRAPCSVLVVPFALAAQVIPADAALRPQAGQAQMLSLAGC